ncbi:MAG: DegT/DnrJ/EryC1/StrS family aminotransferase [Solirubrobacteraceae bacterium]
MSPLEPTTEVPFADLARHHAPFESELMAAFLRVLGASSFILGEEVERFEHEFASFCQVRNCVGVNSGTAALTIMLEALGVGPGDDVIVPAHTFIATALAVVHAGATPVCVEVDRGSGLIDAAAARAAIGPATAAVIAVHLYGQACSMDDLRLLCEEHGLALLEDAAQAHGATFRGTPVGGLGKASAFSFYPSKNLAALGDAGAICSNDDELARKARRLRDLGRGGDRRTLVIGHNERLDGLQAALLQVKLPHLERWNAERRALAGRYRELLEHVELLAETPETPCVYHLFPIRTKHRDALAADLRGRGIETGIHYPLALPDEPVLQERCRAEAPIARDWAARELSLPLFAELTEQELETVATAVNAALSGSKAEWRLPVATARRSPASPER